jgi:TatD DNase family protein
VDKHLEQLERLLREHCQDLVAVGECGLDFSPGVISSAPLGMAEEDLKREQTRIFQRHIELACSLGLPLNVHSRGAGHHALTALATHNIKAQPVLMHAFDGRLAYADRGVELGYFFSCAPIAVREEKFRLLAARVPLANLCVETDSPCLASVKGSGVFLLFFFFF